MLTMVSEEIESYAESHSGDPGARNEELAAATRGSSESHNMTSVDHVLLTVRDGVLPVRKKG